MKVEDFLDNMEDQGHVLQTSKTYVVQMLFWVKWCRENESLKERITWDIAYFQGGYDSRR
jgi:hypothetical protein